MRLPKCLVLSRYFFDQFKEKTLKLFKELVLAIAIVMALFLPAHSQSVKESYLKAKDYFREGNYSFAMESFRELAQQNQKHEFKEYSAFYYALSAYKNGDLGLARSMWLQMERKNAGWKNIGEVFYWLAQVYFEEGQLNKGIYYARRSKLDGVDGLLNQYISDTTEVNRLEMLHYQYPEDELIAFKTAGAIKRQKISNRNFQLLNLLVNKFEFDKEEFGIPDIGDSQLKDEYNIAVLLPFLFDSIGDTRRIQRNRPIMDLYTGLLMAVDTLNAHGIQIRINPYDTKKLASIADELVRMEEMKSMDLIIGPLFPDPARIVRDFCFENKINWVNPISPNSELIQNNPYAFLFKPTIETQAINAARFAVDSLNWKQNALVVYEQNKADSISAYTYAQAILEAGFEVLDIIGVTDTTVKPVFDKLTEKWDTVYTQNQIDSVVKITDRLVNIKTRRSITEKDSIESYEEFFVVEPDSIGHIYVASSKQLYASNFISAVNVRGDSTKIIGRGKWKDHKMLTIQQLQALGVYFIDPDYVDRASDAFAQFRKDYVKNFRRDVSQYVIVGYEMMYYFGSMMRKYGHYFQKGAPNAGFTKGQLMSGAEFRFANSNQHVPITKFINSEVKKLNTY